MKPRILGIGLTTLLFLGVQVAVQAQEAPTIGSNYYNLRSTGQILPTAVGNVPARPAANAIATPASGCDGAIGGCDGADCGLGGSFFERFRSDHCFDDFISPMTNPVFFEDPRNITELRFFYFRHQVPLAAGSGNVQLYAVQARLRLSENVSLIASKDGYIRSSNPLVGDGWADVSMGLKFNLLKNAQCQRLLSAGIMYEMPVGSTVSLQGNGDGVFNVFATGGARLGQRAHLISAGGFRLPLDTFAESRSFYWSNHLDYQLTKRFYLLTEFNWYHWLKSGQALNANFEGLDVFNFGSTNVTGNDIVTGALGCKFKPGCHSEFGLAWEVPLTGRRDIIDNRLTFDFILRY